MQGNWDLFLFIPIFSPKVTNFCTRPLMKHLVCKYPVEKWGKFTVSRGIRKIGCFLALPMWLWSHAFQRCLRLSTSAKHLGF